MKGTHPVLRIEASLLDYKNWPTVDIELIPESRRGRTVRYRDAIISLIDCMPMEQVCKQYSLCRREVWRLLRRCVATHDDGKVWGFRALIFKARQKRYSRKWHLPTCRQGGLAGAFVGLLDRYPAVGERVVQLFLKRTERITVHEARIPIKSLHLQFLQMLRELGVSENEYPFTTKYCGYRAMGVFLKRIFHDNLARAVAVRVHPERGRLLRDGSMPPPTETPPYPLQRVMADGHRSDAKFAVEIPVPTGGTVVVDLERLWLLVIMDVASRAVLGYHLSLDREYTSEDVLRCVEKALVPWKPKSLTIPALRYPPGGGLPNGVIDEFAYATWAEMFVDNAKANLSEHVRDRIKEVVGCAINAGPVAMPERRPFIERLFETLERNGFQRLPSTTGRSPTDGRRNHPEKAAVDYEILLPEMEQVIDVLIAEYNSTPHAALHGHSPLSFLRQYVARGKGIVPRIAEDKRDDLGLLTLRVPRKVVGKPETGRRPYITYEGVTYHNDVLSHLPELVGKKILLHVNIGDVRSVRAFFENGSELGTLTARGYWGVTPHDLRCRKAIQSLKQRGLLHFIHGEDPIQAYVQHLETKVKTHRRSRATLIKIKRTSETAKAPTNLSAGTPEQATNSPTDGDDGGPKPDKPLIQDSKRTPRRTINY